MDLRCNGRVTAAGEEKKIWKKYQRETTKIVQKQRALKCVFLVFGASKSKKNPDHECSDVFSAAQRLFLAFLEGFKGSGERFAARLRLVVKVLSVKC